ncbi:MAG TPA: RHS repeat domain-containing protein, partial [Anaerolineales bacterium]
MTNLAASGYDGLGRSLSVTDPFSATVAYRYDAAGNRTGRLSSLAHSQGSEALASYQHAYDAVGNR